MRLTEAQLRQILCASTQHPEHATGDRSAQVTKNAAVDTSAEPKQKISEIMYATEKVSRTADDVIGATQKLVPGSRAVETSPSLKDAQGGLIEQSKFPLPVPTSGPKRISHRPSVRFTIALSVLLVSAVAAASALLVREQSQSLNVEAREPPLSVALSEPAVAPAADGADRPSPPADAPDRTPATQPHAFPASIQDARPLVLGVGRDATEPAAAASRAMSLALAPAALARPTATLRPARRGGSVAGNAAVAGNTITPHQTQRAGTGSTRVATLGPKAGGAGGSRAESSTSSTPYPDATAAGIAVGAAGASARATSAGLAACLAARPAALRLRQDETAKLFKRGEEYLGQGRIAAARLLFQRAAEACDRRSAFALGATYDPLMLKKFGAALLDPNVATARVWYEQARRLGLSEASRQLELLSTLPQ